MVLQTHYGELFEEAKVKYGLLKDCDHVIKNSKEIEKFTVNYVKKLCDETSAIHPEYRNKVQGLDKLLTELSDWVLRNQNP